MSDHIVDQIAEAFVDLLTETTEADDRITRDRDPAEGFEASEDLPALDVRIGEDNPVDQQVANNWTSEVEIYVDAYAAHGAVDVSRRLLLLRKESYQRIMASVGRLPGVPEVIQVLPGGATPVAKLEQGKIPTGSLRTVWFVTYRHSLTDPSQ